MKNHEDIDTFHIKSIKFSIGITKIYNFVKKISPSGGTWSSCLQGKGKRHKNDPNTKLPDSWPFGDVLNSSEISGKFRIRPKFREFDQNFGNLIFEFPRNLLKFSFWLKFTEIFILSEIYWKILLKFKLYWNTIVGILLLKLKLPTYLIVI